MTDKIVIFSTCASAEEASRIARALVEKRLAACVNIGSPVQSVYRWKGAIEESPEIPLIIKSTRELFESVRAEIERMHSYEVPEVIALPIVEGAENYLLWFDREIGERPKPQRAQPKGARPKSAKR
jgi:periplasmic divalent cation tolerance protein